MLKVLRSSNILWAIVFVFILIICILWIYMPWKDSSAAAEILVDGELYMTLDDISGAEKEITVTTSYGTNVVVYGNNEVYVRSSDCKNQTCVNFGKISKPGQSVICAPHRLTVRICGAKTSDTDI